MSIVIVSGHVFICQMLAHHRMGGFMSARGYRAAKKRLPSQRSSRDCELIPIMIDIHRENYGVYGVRKMWHAMKRAGYTIWSRSGCSPHENGWCAWCDPWA